MTIPTTEIIIFDTSETHRTSADISATVNPAFDLVFNSDGINKPGYSGVQIENSGTAYIIVHWDSLAHHQVVMSAPSYSEVIDKLKPAFGGKSKMSHVIFNNYPIAFEMPVTEILVMTLKDASHRTEGFVVLREICAVGAKKFAFGPTLEDENVIFFVSGWSSVEDHLEFIADPEVKAMTDRLYTYFKQDHFFHTALTRYAGKSSD